MEEQTKELTHHEKIQAFLKAELAKMVVKLEKGNSVRLSKGYVVHSHEDKTLQDYCDKLVNKLHSLGYESTTNHGFGCYDWRFTKKIEL